MHRPPIGPPQCPIWAPSRAPPCLQSHNTCTDVRAREYLRIAFVHRTLHKFSEFIGGGVPAWPIHI